jgi:hypothetical protein
MMARECLLLGDRTELVSRRSGLIYLFVGASALSISRWTPLTASCLLFADNVRVFSSNDDVHFQVPTLRP